MLASRINMLPFIAILGMAAFIRLLRTLGEVQHIGVKLAEDATESAADEEVPVRYFQIGPFLLEIEYKTDSQNASAPETVKPRRIEPSLWKSVKPILLGLVIAVVAAIIIFRIAQPYAFDGLFRLNPQFIEDMRRTQRLISGQDDYPPGHQWSYRTPYWFPWYNIVFWGLGPMLGFAAWSGVAAAAFQVLRNKRWEHVLPLFWIAGLFLYQGQQFVMTMRYMLPLYPFLAIFAAFFIFTLWDWVEGWGENVRLARYAQGGKVFATALFGAVIVATLIWAIAFTTIYTRTNTRVAASRWMYANLTDRDVVGVEHWDDSLPLRMDGKDFYRDHKGIVLELYGEDTLEKRNLMVQWMDQVDYIVLSSNRLYGSIPRLPMRYPLTTQYYKWLFNGQLGFEPVQQFTSYPEFLNLAIPDDKAEEAFTVYDHPKVIIFKKTSAYSHDNTVKLFNSVDLTEVLRLRPLDATASRGQFRLTPANLAADRLGGTWSDLFHPDDFVNRFPMSIWLVMLWGIGLLTFPFTFLLFRKFADRGYAFSKALGILLIAWFTWTVSSYHILPFNRIPILAGIVLMLGCGLLIVRSHRQEMASYVRSNLSILLIEELVFLAFFILDLYIRYQNPDLWHPNFGGEKPMDFTFLNAILKSTYFPPYNPWFAENYINYYYFGQLISAVLVRLTGIVPEVAYNLLVPMFFGLTAIGAYGVVFNVVVSARRRLTDTAPNTDQVSNQPSLLVPTLMGILAVILVLIIGNLGEIKLALTGLRDLAGGGSGMAVIIRGLKLWLVEKQALPIRIGDWYWTATRAIPDTINEFPFFTFLYGDLHAHMIALPYALVVLGLAAHLLLNRSNLRWYDLSAIALTVGALRAINTWDYPTYLGVIGATMILGMTLSSQEHETSEIFSWHEWAGQWLRAITLVLFQVILVVIPMSIIGIRLNFEMMIYIAVFALGVILNLRFAGRTWDPYAWVQKFGTQFLAIIALSILLFLPYILNYATGYASVEMWKGVRTTFKDYLTVHGIFLFQAATFLALFILAKPRKETDIKKSGFELSGWAVYFVPLLVIAEILLLVTKHPLLALLFPLISFGVWINLNRSAGPEARWAAMLIVISLVLTLLVEYVVLRGDVGRMNTVFKFYLQAWVMFGVAGAAGLGIVIDQLVFQRGPKAAVSPTEHPSPQPVPTTASRSAFNWLRLAWWGAFTLLILAGLAYPVAAARAKMMDRYVPGLPPSLNGMDYMWGATYYENNQQISLVSDYAAIQWIRAHIKGSPVIMEGNTGLYHWGNRYSIYTGLPTLIGWDWHTKQQYSLIPGDIVDYRISLVQEFYNTLDPARALQLAQRYHISYVIVGELEHAVYDINGLNKFEDMVQKGILEKVYDAYDVKIYQIPPTISVPASD
jgi:YYY domain-containing protein